MSIENNIVKLPFAEAKGGIKQKLSGYFRSWNRYYIGSTSNPPARWSRHGQNGWTKMVLLYEAWSPDLATSLERELIAWAQQTGFQVECGNRAPGGEGILTDRSTHYIYVLVA